MTRIDHARLGWAFVASPCVSDETRAVLAARLPSLIAGNLAAWRERPRFEVSDALVAQGIPRWDDVDAAVVAVILAAGSELESPMALIVCGGLVTSTALNMIVLRRSTCGLRVGGRAWPR